MNELLKKRFIYGILIMVGTSYGCQTANCGCPMAKKEKKKEVIKKEKRQEPATKIWAD